MENKYYAAMRAKEAVETERKNLAREVEKQATVIVKLSEVETKLRVQLVSLSRVHYAANNHLFPRSKCWKMLRPRLHL